MTDWMAEAADFADTAALIGALDLVISVDTSVAHAAAAVGTPLWLLAPHNVCWRWEMGGARARGIRPFACSGRRDRAPGHGRRRRGPAPRFARGRDRAGGLRCARGPPMAFSVRAAGASAGPDSLREAMHLNASGDAAGRRGAGPRRAPADGAA